MFAAPHNSDQVAVLIERLERLMVPAAVETWLQTPVPALDWEKPVDLIDRGEHRRVGRLISELEGTTAS